MTWKSAPPRPLRKHSPPCHLSSYPSPHPPIEAVFGYPNGRNKAVRTEGGSSASEANFNGVMGRKPLRTFAEGLARWWAQLDSNQRPRDYEFAFVNAGLKVTHLSAISPI